MFCRFLNRLCSTRMMRRLLSTPVAEHQVDLEGYLNGHRNEGLAFLEVFDPEPDVRGRWVLDLGCAFGTRTIAVADAGAAGSVGVDNDPEKIVRARRLAERWQVEKVGFAVQSGTSLGFKSDCFDDVLLLDVIEHLDDPGQVLRECARVLRPGGRLLLSFPPYGSPWGGHLFTHVPVPWAHLLFPEGEALSLWREVHERQLVRGEFSCSPARERAIEEAKSPADLWGCNGMTIASFLDLVDRSPFDAARIRFKTLGNVSGSLIMSTKLREHLVTRVIAVLEV